MLSFAKFAKFERRKTENEEGRMGDSQEARSSPGRYRISLLIYVTSLKQSR